MKRTWKQISSFLMVLCIVLTMLPGVAYAGGSNITVDITGKIDVDEVSNAINNALAAAASGDTITVTSTSIVNLANYVRLRIPEGITVDWQAEAQSNAESNSIEFDSLSRGTFQISDGFILNAGTGNAISNSYPVKIIVAGGRVENRGSQGKAAIYHGSVSELIISGGFVENFSQGTNQGYAIWKSGTDTGDVHISGGMVTGSEAGYAIYDNSNGGVVKISGGSIYGATNRELKAGDGTTPVYLCKLTGLPQETVITDLTSPAGYGINDVKTDVAGKMYLRLPEGNQSISLTANGRVYTGTGTVATNGSTEIAMSTSGTDPSKYTATLNVKLNGELSDLLNNASDVLTLKLSTDESKTVIMDHSAIGIWTADVQNGTWDLYVNDEKSDITFTVDNGNDNDNVTLDYFTVTAGINLQGTATGGTILTNGLPGSNLACSKGEMLTFTATGTTGASNYLIQWSGTHGENTINGAGHAYTISDVQGVVAITCDILGYGTPTITTSELLKTELEKTTPTSIDVPENITLSESISVNADHTLNIALGKTISTANNQIAIPNGKSLTLSGQGTLKADNSTSNSIGIKVAGTLQIGAESKLVAANTGTDSSGIMLGMDDVATGGYNPGTLNSNTGRITVENSGSNSVGINSGNGEGNDSVTLKGGKLTVQNTAGTGIFTDNLTIQDHCAVDIQNSTEYDSKGICAADLLIKDCGSVTIKNPAGFGIFVQPDSTFTVDNSMLSINGALDRIGISLNNDDVSGASMLLQNNSGLYFNNTAGYGLWMDPDAALQVDASLVRVSANGGIGIYWANTSGDIEFHGANNGKVSLAVGALLNGPKGLFRDRGIVCSSSGAVEVTAEGPTPSNTGLTSGDYFWSVSLFAKGGGTEPTINAVTPVITIQPQGRTVKVGESVTLRVEASVSDSGTLSYQWRGGNNSELSPPISGATAATFTPSTAAVGTMYYHVTITNTNNSASGTKTAMINSNQIAVTVQSGNGGGSGGGSSSGGNTTPPAILPATPPAPPTPTVSGSTATTTVTTTTDTSGKAAASVPAAQVDSALKQAQDAAAKSGEAPKVEIKVEAPDNATAVETAVPQAAMTAMASGKLQDMTISSPVANLTFDGAALNTIAGAAVGDVSFSASVVDTANLPSGVQTLIGNRPVYEFSVTSGDNRISQFRGNVTVAVPYQLGAGEDPNAVIISFINADGNLEIVTNGRYDAGRMGEQSAGLTTSPTTGTVVFNTDHFSKYAIDYKKINFTDVADSAWYANAVTFLVARGITGGTTSTTFSPDATLTRGQFITLLLRAYDISADENTADNFADAGSTYYTGYLAAAKHLGIAGGVGGNKFAPEQAITRQEMFTMLYNALKALNKLPAGNSGKNLTDYTDSAIVADWATESMTELVKSGIVTGSGGWIDPKVGSNRAQMAQVLYNLLGK